MRSFSKLSEVVVCVKESLRGLRITAEPLVTLLISMTRTDSTVARNSTKTIVMALLLRLPISSTHSFLNWIATGGCQSFSTGSWTTVDLYWQLDQLLTSSNSVLASGSAIAILQPVISTQRAVSLWNWCRDYIWPGHHNGSVMGGELWLVNRSPVPCHLSQHSEQCLLKGTK